MYLKCSEKYVTQLASIQKTQMENEKWIAELLASTQVKKDCMTVKSLHYPAA